MSIYTNYLTPSTIVLVGAWNKAIFNPPWIHENLNFDPNIDVLFPLNFSNQIFFQDSKTKIQISSDRIIVHPRDLSDESLEKAEQTATKIVETLNHTPLTAIGINFSYLEESPQGTLLDIFDNPDSDSIGEDGWSISDRQVKRLLKKDDSLLNLSLTLTDGTVDIECNFHTQLDPSYSATTFINNKVSRFRDSSITLLESVYGLKLESEPNE